MPQPTLLLIRCLQALLNQEEVRVLEAFPRDRVDWDATLQLATHHRVVPLLYQSLRRQCLENVPEVVLKHLKAQFDRIQWSNLRLTAELLEVLELFQAHGIRALPYKGPTLATYLYGNLALRQFVDLDVLVPKDDVFKAGDLLRSRGYQPFYTLGRKHKATLLRRNIEYVFWRSSPRILLEVHWRVDYDDDLFSLDFEGLWRRRQTVRLAGRGVPHPGYEDLLLILCLHAYRHMSSIPRLAWVYDLAQLLCKDPGLDWSRLLDRAPTQAARRGLLSLLGLTHDLFAVPLPHPVWDALQRDPHLRRLQLQLEERVLASVPSHSPTLWSVLVQKWRLRRRLQEPGRSFLEVIRPNAEDRIWLRLPDSLDFLYYLVRPLRLFVKYAQRGACRITRHWRQNT